MADPGSSYEGAGGGKNHVPSPLLAEMENALISVDRARAGRIMGLRTYLELSREDLKGTRFAAFIEKEDQAAEAIQRQIEFTKYYHDIGVNAPKWQDVAMVIHEAAAQLNLSGIEVQVAVMGMEIFADPLIEKVFSILWKTPFVTVGGLPGWSFGPHVRIWADPLLL